MPYKCLDGSFHHKQFVCRVSFFVCRVFVLARSNPWNDAFCSFTFWQPSKVPYPTSIKLNQPNMFTNNNDNRQPAAFRFVKPWHVVLADTHRREERTTHATEILRKVKEDFKERFKNERRAVWKPQVIEAFHARMRQEYPDENERGLVLVRCTKKAENRTRQANTHGFEGDKKPLYGLAKADIALNVFLENRDPPNLKNEIRRHMWNLNEKYGHNTNGSSPAMANSFFKTVAFFHERLEDAENGDIIAQKLLKSLKPINTINSLWTVLDSSKTDVHAGERETIEITVP
eukprot:scaffold912_cov153-Amphora_coffeaeformis.AAC.6